MRRRDSVFIGIFALQAIASVTTANAEESIFDPENPGMEMESSDAPPPPATSSSGSEEVLFDPENVAPTESASSWDPFAESSSSAPSDARVEFLGKFACQLAVDTAFDRPSEDIVEWTSTMGLRLEYEPAADWRAVLAADFRHWTAGKANPQETDYLFNASDVRSAFDADLGEAASRQLVHGHARRQRDLLRLHPRLP